MAVTLSTIVIDASDPVALTSFWQAVLEWDVIDRSGHDWLELGPAGRSGTTVLIQKVPEGKSAKNRLHLDLTPRDAAQDTELERLLALGATHADVGQENEPWIVLADPEGNEFCLMQAEGSPDG